MVLNSTSIELYSPRINVYRPCLVNLCCCSRQVISSDIQLLATVLLHLNEISKKPAGPSPIYQGKQ